MSTQPTRLIRTHSMGAFTVRKAGADRWILVDPTVGQLGELAFVKITTFGRKKESYWTMPNGETANTLELAVIRTVTQIRRARAIVEAFSALDDAANQGELA